MTPQRTKLDLVALALATGLLAEACARDSEPPPVTATPETPVTGSDMPTPPTTEPTEPGAPDDPSDPEATPSEPSDPPVTRPSGKACVVELHGKGGRGAGSSLEHGITFVHPTGNAEGWDGRQWLYFPESRYAEVRQTVGDAIAAAGCERVIVHGFSNGAAAAAKLYCRGERWDDRVVGYVIDDPVPDHGVEGCKPAPGVRVRLYWTGGLSVATDGWSCSSQDWTCEGGNTIGITRYARALGTEAKQSKNTQHAIYASPPEHSAWLN